MGMESKKPMNIDRVIARVKYFVENLDQLVVKQIDPVKKAQFFGLIFKGLANLRRFMRSKPKNTPFYRGESVVPGLAAK